MSLIDVTLMRDVSTRAVIVSMDHCGIKLSTTCRAQRLVDNSIPDALRKSERDAP